MLKKRPQSKNSINAVDWNEDSFVLSFLLKSLLNPHTMVKDTGVSDCSTLFILSIPRKWGMNVDEFKAVDDCFVCSEETPLDEGAMFIPCLHGFMKERICLSCALSIRNGSKNCPLCRKVISHVFVKKLVDNNTKRKWTKVE
jgi:hypothetical protein